MQKNEFLTCLRQWYLLNANLILNENLSIKLRRELLATRQIYSELFNAMEGTLYDNLNK